MAVRVADLMDQSGVKFGTSGARGLADSITDRIAFAYTQAFLTHLQQRFGQPQRKAVVLGGDLRPSTPRIMGACAAACQTNGWEVIWAGEVPSPAVALHGLLLSIPSIMVTGSHIPDDRNGIKFNRADGEIDKHDEAGIREIRLDLDERRFNQEGEVVEKAPPFKVEAKVARLYSQRFVDFFGTEALQGRRVGVYQHSTVGRDLLTEVLTQLGAAVTPLGRSDVFIPVDTEAVRAEDVELARQWSKHGQFDSIVSADGDCDRPLVADETGTWLRGDIVGVLCARFLGANAVATPISCNTVVERCSAFAKVVRTRIGSPYVIEQMQSLSDAGYQKVVGYEANGGFLQHDSLEYQGRRLSPLPTRDALLPIIALLIQARDTTLSRLAESLPQRFTASDRLQAFATDRSRLLIERLSTRDNGRHTELESMFSDLCGDLSSVDHTDGLRATFSNGEILHLRPSGNAPELRCYAEAGSSDRAAELTRQALLRVAHA